MAKSIQQKVAEKFLLTMAGDISKRVSKKALEFWDARTQDRKENKSGLEKRSESPEGNLID